MQNITVPCYDCDIIASQTKWLSLEMTFFQNLSFVPCGLGVVIPERVIVDWILHDHLASPDIDVALSWLILWHKDMHQSHILSKWLWKWPITHLEHVSKYLNELWNSINFAIWLLFIKKNEICSFPCSLWLNGWNFNSCTLWNCCKAVAFSAWRSFEHVPALGKRKCRKKLKEYWQKYSRKRKQFFTKPTLT